MPRFTQVVEVKLWFELDMWLLKICACSHFTICVLLILHFGHPLPGGLAHGPSCLRPSRMSQEGQSMSRNSGQSWFPNSLIMCYSFKKCLFKNYLLCVMTKQGVLASCCIMERPNTKTFAERKSFYCRAAKQEAVLRSVSLLDRSNWSNTLATWCEEARHWKRPWCYRKDGGQEEKGMTEDVMVGWLDHQLNGHQSEQTPGDGKGQGSLVYCSPWSQRVGHDLVTK